MQSVAAAQSVVVYGESAEEQPRAAGDELIPAMVQVGACMPKELGRGVPEPLQGRRTFSRSDRVTIALQDERMTATGKAPVVKVRQQFR